MTVAARRLAGRLAAGLVAARAHPRHVVLAGAVAGLLLGPLAPGLALAVGVLAAAALARRPPLALALLAAVLGGAVGARARVAALDRSALGPLLGQEIQRRAVLLEPLRAGRFGERSGQAQLLGGLGRGERIVLEVGRHVRWPGAPTGTIVAVGGRLERLRPFEDYQRRRGAHAVLVAASVSGVGVARGGLAGLVDRTRTRAEAGLSAGLPAPQAALARGMVLGQDEALSNAVRQDFRRSGLAHVLAASGENVLLLATLALALLSALGLGLRARLAGVLVLIGLYVPLAGAGPSIERAGVMGAAGVVAGLAGRRTSRWYALLLAAAVTLGVNPRSAADAGWQLSFAAVISILALAPRARAWLVARRLAAPLADAGSLAFAATLGTAPLLAFHFGRLSLVSLPVNLIAAPVIAPIMWLGMLAGAVGQLALGPAALLDAVNVSLLAFVQWLAHSAAALPHASVPLRIGSPLALAGAYAAIAAVVLVPRARAPALLAGAVAAVGLGGPAAAAAPGAPGALVVSFLDVGQGDATLVQDGAATMLVDTGPPGGPLLARLRAAGVRRLDVLVVTHAQADHEGEAAAVLARYPVGLLIDGGAGARTREHAAIAAAAARAGVRRLSPDAGQVIRDGPFALRILWPRREPAVDHLGEDPNQRAIVADLRLDGFDALLPADAESDVTAPLDLPRVDVLKVAHHGSADVGLPALLARLRPKVAVIEVGEHNPYGHPTAQALAALHRLVPHVLRTDLDGTVRVTVEHGAISVAGQR